MTAWSASAAPTGGRVPHAAAEAGRAAPALDRRIEAIVIGASAGGIEALLAVLPQLPSCFAPSLFVVVHLPRERSSLLAELFSARCAIRVCEAEDKWPVEPGTIYFAPADYHLQIDKGPTMSLSADEPVHYSRPSIDVLFETAADVYGDTLAAVVLTGANDDGAAGLAAVHRQGGTTIVQSPDDARMPTMPSAALARVAADFVLPIGGIAALLATLAPATTQ